MSTQSGLTMMVTNVWGGFTRRSSSQARCMRLSLMGDIHQQRRSVNDPCRNLAPSTKRLIFPSHYFLCKVERHHISRPERSDVCLTLPVVPYGFRKL